MHTTLILCLFATWGGVVAEIDYLGVAMAGIDFGCNIDGTCPATRVQVPLASLGGADSAGQMKHFVEDDGMNTFRLPTSWQYITAGQPAGTLDKINWGNFDKLVQACLQTGAYCMLDLHNFARYDGKIIGQGGPTDDVFAGLWKQIATAYAKEDRIMFGLMNEPHEIDINLWSKSCQAAVTAIRKAGATSQIILLPGTNFASAETFVSTGSADALAAITNPDGSTDNLMLDIHKYLDINNSGSYSQCTTNNVEGFRTITDWLRKNKRQAIVSETGASMDPSCMTNFCEQNTFIATNEDVIAGFVGWAAGGFDATYTLTLTPSKSGDTWTDNKLMKQCILTPFARAAKAVITSAAPSSITVAASITLQEGTQSKTTTATTEMTTTSPSAVSPIPDTKNNNASAFGISRWDSFSLCLILAGLMCVFTI